MTTRRSFLKAATASAAAARAFAGLAHAAGTSKPPLGLQLYSLRKQLELDVRGTLAKVKAWGFDEVETFGEFGAQIAAELKSAGLGVRSMHVGYERLQQDLPGVLRDADAVAARTIINPSLPHERKPYASREEILKAAHAFAGWARACKAAGKRFAYHIHGQEFGKTAEGTLFDVLASEAGPDVGFEADVFWVTAAGSDPATLMKRYPGRFWFTHLKDLAKGVAAGSDAVRSEESQAVLGTGQIDIKGVVAAGAQAGVELHFIEDESADPLGRIPQSVAYYRSL